MPRRMRGAGETTPARAAPAGSGSSATARDLVNAGAPSLGRWRAHRKVLATAAVFSTEEALAVRVAAVLLHADPAVRAETAPRRLGVRPGGAAAEAGQVIDALFSRPLVSSEAACVARRHNPPRERYIPSVSETMRRRVSERAWVALRPAPIVGGAVRRSQPR